MVNMFKKIEDRFIEWLRQKLDIPSPSLLYVKDCRACVKWKTMDCPNSARCYCTIDKPYFVSRW